MCTVHQTIFIVLQSMRIIKCICNADVTLFLKTMYVAVGVTVHNSSHESHLSVIIQFTILCDMYKIDYAVAY